MPNDRPLTDDETRPDDIEADRDRERAEEAAKATRAFLDSPVGKLLKAHPEMTTAEAMRRLGYWKRPH